MPFQADRNLGEPFHNAMTFASAWFFQDDWKIRPNLTLNLGLRYELDLPPLERVDKMASFDPRTSTLRVAGGREAYIDPATGLLLIRPRPDVGRRLWITDKNNWAPRIGLAWRPFGGTGTVVRAGYGGFYNHQIVGNGITPLSRNSPFRLRQTSGPLAATARPSLANPFSGNPSVVPPGIQEDFRTAYVNQWSFGVQREILPNMVLDVAYLGSQGHKLPIRWNINQAPPGPGAVNARRPYQGYGSITGGFISSTGNSNYNGLQVRIERRFTEGFSFLSSYSWSKAIDDSPGISTDSDAGPFFAQDARNLAAERSLSDFDVAHRFVFSTVYDLPFGKSQSRVVKLLAAGWQLTGILSWQSGRPFTVTAGSDVSNTGGNNDRPNVVGDWRVDTPGPDRWFNTAAFANATAGSFGNAGRNILRGDGLVNVDLGVFRAFKFTERWGLQFRTEFFNVANHPNFYQPTANRSSAAFGTISRAAFQSQTGAQRQIQFAIKILF
jgi:hypothetical protein